MNLDENLLRSVAVLARTLLAQLVADPVERAEVDRALAFGLAQPAGAAADLLNEALFVLHPAVSRWSRVVAGPGVDNTERNRQPGGRPQHDSNEYLKSYRDKNWNELWRAEPTRDLARPTEAPLSEPDAVDGQSFSLSIPDLESADATAGVSYPAHFGITSAAIPATVRNLLARAGLIDLPIPSEGLATIWTVLSEDIRLDRPLAAPADDSLHVDSIEAGPRTQYVAVFPLHIPASGRAPTRTLQLTPLAAPAGRLDIEIRVGEDLYRRVTVNLTVLPTVKEEEPGSERVPAGVRGFVFGEQRVAPAAHAGLAAAAPWQQPQRRIELQVEGDVVLLYDSEDGTSRRIDWTPDQGAVAGAIDGVRRALDAVRDAFSVELNAPPPATLAEALTKYSYEDPEWLAPAGGSPPDALLTSEALADLASNGLQLYQSLFSEELRDWLEQLEPGDLLKFSWTPESTGRAPVIPLQAAFTGTVPRRGQPVDPAGFVGLRQRLSYAARRPLDPSKALGDWHDTVRSHFLYWGTGVGDELAALAGQHARDLESWQPATLLPTDRARPSTNELATFLREPAHEMMSVVYFYCHCTTDGGTNPVLRFGPTAAADSVLKLRDIQGDSSALPGSPIVFINACNSGSADPVLSSMLMDAFFARRCRAYIGSEVQVPAGLAANLAIVFFSFLYGGAGRTQAPVSEAMSQTRRFLWRCYGNLGGLFYASTNDYKLYAKSDAELRKLRTAAVPIP